MDDEDELYDDSLLFKRTLSQVPNMSAMSCSSRQSGRLSLAFRNPASQISAPLHRNIFRMPITMARNNISHRTVQTALEKKDCQLCGSHQLNCKDGGCKTRSTDVGTGAFRAKDVNQNSINHPSKQQREQEAGSQENQEGAGQRSKSRQSAQQSAQQPSETNSIFLSQESFFSSNLQGTRSQKPSDVLKSIKLNSRMSRKKQKSPSKRVERQSSTSWSIFKSQPELGTPWAIDRLKKGKSDETSNAILIDDLAKKHPKKKRKRTPKNYQDLSHIEGGTSSEDDGEEEQLKACPIYKRIPGTNFGVDALCHGEDSRLQAHFLTRFRAENCIQHNDVPIYCTPVTASLMRERNEFREDLLRTLEFDTPRIIDGVKVTAIDARNEPGSAVILFQLPNNVNILYIGTLRADFTLESHQVFWSPNFETNYLMVDTTECDPKVNCRLQEEVELRVKIIVNDFLEKHPKWLVAVVSDGLREKRLYTTLALGLELKVFAHGSTAKTVTAINDPILMDWLTRDRKEARLHIIEHSSSTLDGLKKQLKMTVSRALVINPRKDYKIFDVNALQPETSWNVTVLDIPVLDGTSHADLKRLVRFLRPKRLISNLPPNHDEIHTSFQEWLNLRDPTVPPVSYRRK